jgi:hypothetical protein
MRVCRVLFLDDGEEGIAPSDAHGARVLRELAEEGLPVRTAADAVGGFQILGRAHLIVTNPFWASLCSYVLQKGALQDRGCSQQISSSPIGEPSESKGAKNGRNTNQRLAPDYAQADGHREVRNCPI